MTRDDALEALIDAVLTMIRVAEERAKATARSATHVESKQENDKDTRGLEETYLAAGQAQRVAELELDVAELRAVREFRGGDTIRVGALVTVEDDAGRTRRLLVARRAGGLSTELGGRTVQVVTPGSPLGQGLIGKEEGDEVPVRIKGGVRTYEITGVS